MRNAVFFVLVAVASVVWAVLAGSALGAVTVVVIALILGYIGLYNLRVAQARELMYAQTGGHVPKALGVGVLAPARVWHGNGLLLAVTDNELIAVSVPLLGEPILLWRSQLEACQAHSQVGWKTGTVSVASPAGSATLRTAKPEVEQIAGLVSAFRSPAV